MMLALEPYGRLERTESRFRGIGAEAVALALDRWPETWIRYGADMVLMRAAIVSSANLDRRWPDSGLPAPKKGVPSNLVKPSQTSKGILPRFYIRNANDSGVRVSGRLFCLRLGGHIPVFEHSADV